MTQIRYQTAWKFYFWIVLVLTVLYVLFVFALQLGSNHYLWFYHLELAISIFVLVGVFGYAYQKKIGVWYVWFLLLCVSVVVPLAGIGGDLLVGDIDWEKEISETSMWDWLVVLGLFILLVLPSYLALFLYSLRSSHIWATTPNNRL